MEAIQQQSKNLQDTLRMLEKLSIQKAPSEKEGDLTSPKESDAGKLKKNKSGSGAQ